MRSFTTPLLPLALLTISAIAIAAPDEQKQKDERFIATLMRLSSININDNAAIKAKVIGILGRNSGKPLYLDIVEKFKLKDPTISAELLRYSISTPSDTHTVRATRLLLKADGPTPYQAIVENDAKKMPLALTALGKSNDGNAITYLAALASNAKLSRQQRSTAVTAMGQTIGGQRTLLKLVTDKKLKADTHFAASNALFASPDNKIREAAAKHLKPPASVNAKPLPPISELIKRKGTASNGLVIMRKTLCFTCHKVGKEGFDVGPALTEIGSKLSREAMYTAILDPSAGIEHNYEAWHVETQDGEELVGLIISQTDSKLTIRVAGGITTTYAKSDIFSKRKLETSLMPSNMQGAMTEQELIDLVQYLTTLKKK
jgi:putative heme-binding domain-containing protein